MCPQSEKNLLNSNISTTCPHNMVNFGPLAADIGSGVWGTPANFNRFRVLPSLLQRHCSPEANQICTMFGCLLSWYTMYTFLGALASGLNLSTCKIHFASKSCILLYWRRYCTALQQRGQPNSAAWYKEWNYRTFAEGTTYFRLGSHHVGHQPTFKLVFCLNYE